MICAIYMAGGNSRRFSQNKLLTPLGPKELYRYGLEKLLILKQKGLLDRVIVVSQHPQLLEQVNRLYPDAETLFCPDCRKGASYTIRAGLARSGNARGYLFSLADSPFVNLSHLEEIVNTFRQNPEKITGLSWQQELISPVLFPAWMVPELRALQLDQGGKKAALAHPDQWCLVEASCEEEVLDVDDSASFQRALKIIEKNKKI